MMTTSISFDRRKAAVCSLTDLALFAFVYFIPALSHLTSVPFYILEPMRVAVLLGVIVTRSFFNAYFTAATLPVFSFAVAAHPVLAKSLLMGGELVINVFFLQFFLRRFRSKFFAAFASVLLSKAIYYAGKFLMIKASLLDMSVVSTPLWIQLVVAALLSGLFFLGTRKREI